MQPTLTIIGAGNLGKALGRLWAQQGPFRLQDILTRSMESAQQAAGFIGAGRAVASHEELSTATIYLIATPDGQIGASCEALAAAGLLGAGTIVFHCSGALPSSVLQAAAQRGAAIASVHPIRSFAAPAQAAATFSGTWCGVEGDPHALDTLLPAFAAIGAQTVAIEAQHKMLYHSAAVFASNYLVTLVDAGLQAYGKAGIPRETGLRMLEPLVRKTVDDVFRIGPEQALQGPIARGDIATVQRQYQAVSGWNRRIGSLYRRLATLTADLAARRRKPG